MSKGSGRRPRLVSISEYDLRSEYLKATPERKAEILKELEKIRNAKQKKV